MVRISNSGSFLNIYGFRAKYSLSASTSSYKSSNHFSKMFFDV